MISINSGRKIIFMLAFFLLSGGCVPEPEPDPCLQTQWPKPKEYEIKLAVRVMETNPQLPGGTPGSLSPVDFQKMVVNGTIEKIDCSETGDGFSNLGNTYLTKGVDLPAPLDVPKAYWIGHVVYVYEFGNDKDHLEIDLLVKITMDDGQSYMCNVSEKVYSEQIIQMSGEMYHYVLIDIYSNNWIKV